MNRRTNKPVWAAAALLLAVLFAAAAAAEAQDFTVFTDGAGQTYEWFEVQKLHYGADHKVTAVSGRFERFAEDDEDGHGEYPADGEVYTYSLSEDFHAEMTAGMTADTMDNVPVTDLYQWYLDAYLDGQAPESGELVPMERGTVPDVVITGCEKGAPGTPGELRGSFTGAEVGTITKNTACGVFGVFQKIPEGERMEIGGRESVHTGRASILCTLDGGGPEEYEVCITEINRGSREINLIFFFPGECLPEGRPDSGERRQRCDSCRTGGSGSWSGISGTGTERSI